MSILKIQSTAVSKINENLNYHHIVYPNPTHKPTQQHWKDFTVNNDQKNIIEFDHNQPLLVVAGAGTGKTQTLTERIIYLLKVKQISPEKFLIVSFSKEGTANLSKRLEAYFHHIKEPFPLSHSIMTVNSLCYRHLHSNFFRANLEKPIFVETTLEGELDLIRLSILLYLDRLRLKECLEILQLSELDYCWDQVFQEIKLNGEPEEDLIDSFGFSSGFQDLIFEKNFKLSVTLEKFKTRIKYHRWLVSSSCYYSNNELDVLTEYLLLEENINIIRENLTQKKIDPPKILDYTNIFDELFKCWKDTVLLSNTGTHDDVLLFFLDILENPEHEDFLKIMQEIYEYTFIDEFQDLNNIQLRILKLILGEKKKLSAFGDDDQSIYEFRGSLGYDLFNNLKKDFTDLTLKRLVYNYRSSKNILQLAEKCVENNTKRVPKTLVVPRERISNYEEPIYVKRCKNQFEEAEYISTQIGHLISAGVNPSEIAVLYRCRKQGNYLPTTYLQEKLKIRNIKYNLIVEQDIFSKPSNAAEFNVLLSFCDKLTGKRITEDQLIMSSTIDNNNEFALKFDFKKDDEIENGLQKYLKILKRIKEKSINYFVNREVKYFEFDFLSVSENFYQEICIVLKEIHNLNNFLVLNSEFCEQEFGNENFYKFLNLLPSSLNQILPLLKNSLKSWLYNSNLQLEKNFLSRDNIFNFDNELLKQLEFKEIYMQSNVDVKIVIQYFNDYEKSPDIEKKSGYQSKFEKSGIWISTIHQAKGLEWPHVFVPHFNREIFKTKKYGPANEPLLNYNLKKSKFEIPTTALKKKRKTVDCKEEESRLSHVAFTRAMKSLYISFIDQNFVRENEKWKMSDIANLDFKDKRL
ncbi:hypothetical protein HDU92_002037 [Lobulomyces angularis]|nr:hypothetical protein HDU92_002037 [Lobulomyces angularis]